MTKFFTIASIFLIFTACSELGNLIGNIGNGDNITIPSDPDNSTNPDKPINPPTDPDEPANPDKPISPPTDPDEPNNPNPPINPPIDPDGPVDTRPLCPIVIDTPELQAISDKYKGYNIGMGNFVVHDDPIPDSTTDRAKAERMQITPEDRGRILRIYGIIRFVVNSKEFEDNFKNKDRNYPSGITLDAGLGSIKEWEPLNKDRYLVVLQKFNLNVGLTKRFERNNASAVVGPFLYLHPDDFWAWDKNQRHSLSINLPNFISWSELRIITEDSNMENKYARDSWLAPLLFHESIHIAGFNHTKGAINRDDAVYTAEKVFNETYNDEFRNKYSKELAELSKYYEDRYANWINYPTLIYPNDKCKQPEAAKINSLQVTPMKQQSYDPPSTIVNCDLHERINHMSK